MPLDLDPQTLLLAMIFVALMTAGGSVLVWLQDRRQTEVLWIAISGLVMALAMIGRATMPLLVGVAFANFAILFSFGLLRTAFRSLRGYQPQTTVIMMPPLIWLGLYLIPGFRANFDLRISLNLILLLIPVSLAVRELWLTPHNSPIIRWPLFVVLVLQLILMIQRVIRSVVWPSSFHVSFEAIPGFDMLMIDLTVIILVSNFSIIALVNEKTLQWHQNNARFDFLTNVFNRMYFDECLIRHFQRGAKTYEPLALIMIDADSFKEYNDQYGHLAGDRCLQKIAKTLVESCRPTDVVGRYGGEEFIVLLPNTNGRAAVAIAERILQQVHDLRLPHAKRPEGIMTVSLGVASFAPSSNQLTPKHLIEAADRALYKAKEQGRDRVCSAEVLSGHCQGKLPRTEIADKMPSCLSQNPHFDASIHPPR